MKQQHGFSLVELSIVLVILGLLAGGIISGRHLIRIAELRGFHTDISNIRVALSGFKNKYHALPGDMNNATLFWGAQAGSDAKGPDPACSSLDYTQPATDKRTCNGDGNNIIESAVPDVRRYESLRAWQHLSNAGLIERRFTGVPYDTSGGEPTHIPGENVFGSNVGNSVAWVFETRYFPGTGYWPVRDASNKRYLKNDLIIGGKSSDEVPHSPFMTTGEAYILDTKFDDGKPFKGNIRSANFNLCTTAVSASDYVEADYATLLGDDGYRCSLILKGLY